MLKLRIAGILGLLIIITLPNYLHGATYFNALRFPSSAGDYDTLKYTISDNKSSEKFTDNKTLFPKTIGYSINNYSNKRIIDYPYDNHPIKNEFSFWKLLSISGEVRLKAYYRTQERVTNDITDTQEETSISGGFLINTSSYFVHPNFMLLDVNAAYYPERYSEKHLIIPERSELNNVKKLGIKTTFFNNKEINLIAFANFDQSYQNREYLTNIISNSSQIGSILNYSNNVLPFTVDFSRRKWDQKELETNREFQLIEHLFHTSLNKSFSSRDKNKLEYSHNDIKYINENAFLSHNKIDELSLYDKLYLDSEKKHYFNSRITNKYQRGSIDYSRLQAFENLTLKLRKNLIFSNNYNYSYNKFNTYSLRQHNVSSSLDHKLYQSLDSRIFAEYNNIKHTTYKENYYKTGVDFSYNKIIPIGKLSLYYKYYRYHQEMDSDPVLQQINDEEVYLVDNQMVLLSRPYVDLNSVVVKDITGTIIYQINLDFTLIVHNNYLELKRIPGGLIANNSTVLVDYTATQPGMYKYDANGHYFSVNLSLFKNRLDLYYKRSSLDFTNLEYTDNLTLNYFDQNIFGGIIDFKFINFGAEYDNYNSTIIPYRMTRYFCNIQKNFNEKALFTLSGNQQNYHLVNENVDQVFEDVTGMFAMTIHKQTKFTVDLTYRKQKGLGIDLDLYTAKSEISTRYRQIYLSLGFEIYKRNYVGEKINFRGVTFQVARKF